ncbi:MAG: HD domain-containing protein [candidate division KSB1 bacterium]|nr:HD domain-containing protein [candidate division KSB1 bacterium]MDZ7276073.1 HD domain-containing protein [candidate division KSB1 bacterium]MDZ7287147.1 HD domain-containing protein [candidate division KSB1 bacterium]MDZ7296928.1 HD domain-containing protein [candidate division KSB1 bacterium]MDZ7309393.1 HD domain-containing protein [candidate division KSB1 bacterium]
MTSNPLNPLTLIQKYYDPAGPAYRLLVVHSVLVAAKALALARAYLHRHPGAALDLTFIEQAAWLHDIGILRCHAPALHCHGREPYIRHTILGREILEQEGLPAHALVCERHTGAGLTAAEVLRQNLPLPVRDYLPLSLEEKIICLADRFYVKTEHLLYQELTLPQIREKLAKHGPAVLARLQELCDLLLPAA